MFAGIVWKIYVGFVADIDIKILNSNSSNSNEFANPPH
jgi:hypothetical protein